MNDIVVTGTITILMITLLHFALGRTLYGRWLYACGQNASASALAGVPVASVQRRAYAASGYCAAVAAIFYTASSGRGMADHGHELMLDILVAVLIGGASLRGGKGKLTWTLSAVVFVILLNDTLKSLGIAGPFLMIIKGALVGVAAVLDAVRNRS